MKFHNMLINWYLENKRDLPWRNTNNPYEIWLSEIILQQTRVAQGLPYFNSFITTFPTVFDLALASEQEILKLWQGLGYYSRARNLHHTAKIIAFEMKGIFPNNYKDLLTLKGVGEYTAAAIASFSYNERVAVVDGNVFRVLSRYFAIESDISVSKTKSVFTSLANNLLPADAPALFNQAIMEFGALQCVPKSPNCANCPLNDSCKALQLQKIADFPVKSKKIKSRNRFFNYLIFEDSNKKTRIQQRIENDIWQNLYEFPLIETPNAITLDEIIPLIPMCFSEYTIQSVGLTLEHPKAHKLSHQNLWITFWRVKVKEEFSNGLLFNEIIEFPYPIVLSNFIQNILLPSQMNPI